MQVVPAPPAEDLAVSVGTLQVEDLSLIHI